MFKTIQGVRLYYRTAGEGKPVVMLHGMDCDHRLMAGCMEPVFQSRPGYRRVYIDLPGMGRSEAPLECGGSDGMLELLRALLTDLTGKERFLLVGESYGGYLARGILTTELAAQVDGLMLLCPVIVPEPERRDLPEGGERCFDRVFLEELSPKDRTAFCTFAVLADRRTYRRYEAEIAPGLRMGNGAFLTELKRRYPFSFDVDARIHETRFNRPTLLLAGRQDGCVGYRDLWKLLEDYPRAAFSVLDLAGHNLQIERPALFAALIGDWLDRTESCGR